MEKCRRCIVGMIGAKPILAGDWVNATSNFEKIIAEWNERTKRHAVPNPGFANKFSYCPVCGTQITEVAP